MSKNKIMITMMLFATTAGLASAQLPKLEEFVAPVDPDRYSYGSTIAYDFFDDMIVTSLRDKEGRIIDCYSANLKKTSDGLVEVAWLDGSSEKMAGTLRKTDSGVRYTVIRHPDKKQVGWELNMRRRNVPEQDVILIIRSLNSGRLIAALASKASNSPQSLQQQIDYEKIRRLQNELEVERMRTTIENINGWLSLPSLCEGQGHPSANRLRELISLIR